MKNIKFAIVALVTVLCLPSCVVRPVPQGQPMAIRPHTQNPQGFGEGLRDVSGQQGARRLDSITVKKATFEANIDSTHAGRRQDVCDYAAARFEETGKVPTDQEVSRHFGFECHVRIKLGTGGIQSRKIRPTEAPQHIQAMFL